MDHDDFHTTERIASRRRTGRPSLRGRTLPPPSYAIFPISLAETSAGNRAGFRHPAGYHAGSIPAAPTKTPNSPTRTAMPTASDTPARPKPETAVGKTPAVPIRSLHDKALKSLARRMTGYTQKEIKTIYEYDPDGTRRCFSSLWTLMPFLSERGFRQPCSNRSRRERRASTQSIYPPCPAHRWA